MPEISIIIPVYKTEEYLRRCIDSILCQTVSDFEVILIDDGSPDGCPAICDDYAQTDRRVRVLHQENAGASAARNAGLDLATGRFITFVDSDDWVAPQYLEHLVVTLREHSNSYAVSVFTSDPASLGQLQEHPSIEPGILYETAKDFKRIYCGGLVGYTCGRMFLRETVEAHRIRFRSQANGDYNEDLLFALTYFQHCSGVCYTGYADYFYYTHEGSLSRGAFGKNHWVKYLEKFRLWEAVLRRYGATEFLPSLADDTLYQLLVYIQSLADRQWLPDSEFYRCFAIDGFAQLLDSATGERENPRVVALLLKKRFTALWWKLKLGGIARRLKNTFKKIDS